ncbi:hypothetical protein FJTKL_04862 [Diaporthe vaccinii]|uniref:2'-phosphotransferase n=1 Tax=Diaporthe vaccinii TaxID=105482 RepID=A0ABR4DSE1_9PEZI
MDADELAAQFEDKASVGGRTGGRKAGGGSGGKGKPGDGDKQREKQISMALSRLLRHQALNAGIKLDKEGYAPLDRVRLHQHHAARHVDTKSTGPFFP